MKRIIISAFLLFSLHCSNPQNSISPPRTYFIGNWTEINQIDTNVFMLTDTSYFHFERMQNGMLKNGIDNNANTWIIEDNLFKAIRTINPNQGMHYDYQYQNKSNDTLLLLFIWKNENLWRTFIKTN
jgi:hypothetical protein